MGTGMSDRQFDAHIQSLYRQLEHVKRELESQGAKSESLEKIMKDMEEQLKRP